MSGRRKWSETRDTRLKSSADRARYAASGERFRARLNKQLRTLAELRRARSLTQEQLAAMMQISQAQVSRVENQADLYLSSLRTYIEALGGELQIRVAFPGGDWTEVAVGDITGVETPSSGASGAPPSVYATANTTFKIAAVKAGSMHTTATFSPQFPQEGWVAPVVLSTCLVNVGETAISMTAELPYGSPMAESFAGLWKSDFGPQADIIYLAGPGSIESPAHIELQAKVNWVESAELRVPNDADKFVASARIKEGQA